MIPTTLLPFAIKAAKASQFENGIKRLVRELRAPVPGARHAAVNATAGIVKGIATAAVKGRAKEIIENVFAELFQTAKTMIDHGLNARVLFANLFHVFEARDNGAEDTRNCRSNE